MPSSLTPFDAPWEPLSPQGIADLFGSTAERWWLSGGVALDHWLGRTIRDRPNSDVSVLPEGLTALLGALPPGASAWIPSGDAVIRFEWGAEDVEQRPIYIHDDRRGVWVLQVNVEDGTDAAWIYKRDPRLQVAWSRAVCEVRGIPTGAPELQLVWKALRPRPEDDVDKDAVVSELSEASRSWWEKAILSVHPHSSWAIHVRSPFAPAKASWNRKNAV